MEYQIGHVVNDTYYVTKILESRTDLIERYVVFDKYTEKRLIMELWLGPEGKEVVKKRRKVIGLTGHPYISTTYCYKEKYSRDREDVNGTTERRGRMVFSEYHDTDIVFGSEEYFKEIGDDPDGRKAAVTGVKLLLALRYIHAPYSKYALDMVHGNVSPKNIIIAENNVLFPKLTGYADPIVPAPFCSPEIIFKKNIGKASDIYQWALLVSFILFKDPVCDNGADCSEIIKKLKVKLKSYDKKSPAVTLIKMLIGCLNPDPEKRFTSDVMINNICNAYDFTTEELPCKNFPMDTRTSLHNENDMCVFYIEETRITEEDYGKPGDIHTILLEKIKDGFEKKRDFCLSRYNSALAKSFIDKSPINPDYNSLFEFSPLHPMFCNNNPMGKTKSSICKQIELKDENGKKIKLLRNAYIRVNPEYKYLKIICEKQIFVFDIETGEKVNGIPDVVWFSSQSVRFPYPLEAFEISDGVEIAYATDTEKEVYETINGLRDPILFNMVDERLNACVMLIAVNKSSGNVEIHRLGRYFERYAITNSPSEEYILKCRQDFDKNVSDLQNWIKKIKKGNLKSAHAFETIRKMYTNLSENAYFKHEPIVSKLFLDIMRIYGTKNFDVILDRYYEAYNMVDFTDKILPIPSINCSVNFRECMENIYDSEYAFLDITNGVTVNHTLQEDVYILDALVSEETSEIVFTVVDTEYYLDVIQEIGPVVLETRKIRVHYSELYSKVCEPPICLYNECDFDEHQIGTVVKKYRMGEKKWKWPDFEEPRVEICDGMSRVFIADDDIFRAYYMTYVLKKNNNSDEDNMPVIIEKEIPSPKRVVSENKVEVVTYIEKDLPEVVTDIAELRENLLEKVKGQDHAVNAFCDAMFNAEFIANYDEERRGPVALFVFAGPPGTGKTFLAENAAGLLDRPYKRFDMSEYASHQDQEGLIGFDYTFKNATAGKLTQFVYENPNTILLFDEIEKAHIDILHIFYQMLDAGILTDKYYATKKIAKKEELNQKEEYQSDDSDDNWMIERLQREIEECEQRETVNFRNTIIIFTTNVGRHIYEGKFKNNCSAVPTNAVIEALRTEMNPYASEGTPYLPAALVSRMATGNILMFNHLKSSNLVDIMDMRLSHTTDIINEIHDIRIEIDKDVYFALMLKSGSNLDARMLSATSERIVKAEIGNLLKKEDIEKRFDIKKYHFAIDTKNSSEEIRSLFKNPQKTKILVYSNRLFADVCNARNSGIQFTFIHDAEVAIEKLCEQEFDMVLIDIAHRSVDSSPFTKYAGEATVYSNATASVWRDGRKLLMKLNDKFPEISVYLLEDSRFPISKELLYDFINIGASGKISKPASDSDEHFGHFEKELKDIGDQLYMHKKALEIQKKHNVLNFETAIKPSEDEILIQFRNFELEFSPDADDAGAVVLDYERPDVRFDDIIGAEKAKEELKEFIDYLKNPRKYKSKGLKAPKGVLLYGSPGTGKTMLAKALACEADINFMSAVGSGFTNQYVGSGPRAVRELFEKARKYAPTIVFIDEVDAIARQRTGSEYSHAEEETLNTLLHEIDGFSSENSAPVFVLAATNFGIKEGDGGIAVLDEAFSRRFDAKIKIELPDKSERIALIKMLLGKFKGKHKISDEDIEKIAENTPGVSPAILTNIFEAACKTALRKDTELDMTILDDALQIELYGEESKRKISEDTLRRTARHECGHALCYCLSGKTPSYLTIVARGNHGGYMKRSDEDMNSGTSTKADILNDIRTALAGRAAEIVYYGQNDGLDTGASSDLKNATYQAYRMITSFGMDEEFGIAVWDRDTAMESEKVRQRVNEILKAELDNAIKLIGEHKENFDKLVELLLKENKLTGEEIRKTLGI